MVELGILKVTSHAPSRSPPQKQIQVRRFAERLNLHHHLVERWQQFPDLVFSVDYYISIKSLELSFLRGTGGALASTRSQRQRFGVNKSLAKRCTLRSRLQRIGGIDLPFLDQQTTGTRLTIFGH